MNKLAVIAVLIVVAGLAYYGYYSLSHWNFATPPYVARNNCISALSLGRECYNADSSWNPAGSVVLKENNLEGCKQLSSQRLVAACDSSSVLGDYVSPPKAYCCGQQ